MKDSSDLARGITGTTIGKRSNDDMQLTSKNTTEDKLPKLHVKSYGKRNYRPDNVKIQITIKNKLVRGFDNGRNAEPLECFKVTPLNSKKHT